MYYRLQATEHKHPQNPRSLNMWCGLLASDQGNAPIVIKSEKTRSFCIVQQMLLHWKSITLLPLIECSVTPTMVGSIYGNAWMWLWMPVLQSHRLWRRWMCRWRIDLLGRKECAVLVAGSLVSEGQNCRMLADLVQWHWLVRAPKTEQVILWLEHPSKPPRHGRA